MSERIQVPNQETDMPEIDLSSDEQLTVQDIITEANEGTQYHTVLEMWREVLKPIATERTKPITPQWANRIVTQFEGLSFQRMPIFRDRYYEFAQQLADILNGIIDEDDECLNLTSAEEDIAYNAANYKRVLTEWQKQVLTWELNWSTEDSDAAEQIAAMSEIHKMFFDTQGLVALLDQVNMVFTDEDREALAAELNTLKESEGR